jgi:hypothetical protein
MVTGLSGFSGELLHAVANTEHDKIRQHTNRSAVERKKDLRILGLRTEYYGCIDYKVNKLSTLQDNCKICGDK